MGDKVVDQDYSTVCRTCLQPAGDMLNLNAVIDDNYGTGETQVTYMECLRYCMPVQDVVGVEMPKMICSYCASALQVAYWFTKNACKAQELLKVRLKELQEKRRRLERQAFAEELKKPKRYRCKICNAKLETKRSLKDHVKLHLDIIFYTCQMCPYENHNRNYLIEHYQLVHGIEASHEQLKPSTKSTSSHNTSAAASTSAAAAAAAHANRTNEYSTHQQVFEQTYTQQQQACETYLPTQNITEVYTSSTPLQQNSEYIYTTADANTTSLTLPLEGNGSSGTATIFTQPNGETFTFNTFDGAEINVQNDLNVGNEFVVMADGTVQDAMGRGVVILQSAEDGTLALQNGLVLENLIQVPNAETANMIMAQNEVVQMDVDDLIVEEPQNSPEQEVPAPLDEDMIPATIIKKVNCKICTKDFDSQGELKNHMLTHSDIPHFFCEHCPFYTFFKIDLHQHYKSKHNVQPTNKQLQPRNRQRAASGSLGSDTESQRKNVVVQRIERFPKAPRMVYYCDICFYECDLKYEIKRHYSMKHKITVNEVHQRISKTPGDILQPKMVDQQSIQMQAVENGPPDYPNGLNCRKCNELFYWRNELYEHYKLHNAEEMALKQQKLQQKIQKTPVKTLTEAPLVVADIPQPAMELTPASQLQPATAELHQTIAEPTEQEVNTSEVQPHMNSASQFQEQEHNITTATTTLESSMNTFDNVDTMSLGFAGNQNINNPAPLTPSSSSTYTLPSDAIPQIVEMEQTIETDMDFDFNGDALFEDFDDVDVEHESDDNDMRNIVLTSDDDYEDIDRPCSRGEVEDNDSAVKVSGTGTATNSFCAQCQKMFTSHYQFENHMFLHRGLAPYRCEMCTNLYNTKRALIRHYKAIHKKIPSRDMIQAKGDKVYIYDKTPMDYLSIEESKSITLMCAKCTYESIDFPSVQLHLNTNHSIHEDSYILRKLPYECPRCIRSFATKARLIRHLDRNHSTTSINLQQVQMNTINTATTTTTTTTASSLNNNVNMMQINAECDREHRESVDITKATTRKGNGNGTGNGNVDNNSVTTNCVAVSTVMASSYEEDKTIAPTLSPKHQHHHRPASTSMSDNEDTLPTTYHTARNNFERTNEFDCLIKIEESNIKDCELLRSEDSNSPIKPPMMILYKCQMCHLTCSSLESVVVHGKSQKCSELHQLSCKENPLFQCEICQSKYKTLNLLVVHLKRHIARKYQCSQCPKTFVSSLELEAHQSFHRNVRPHKCDMCPNSFRYAHHLKRHKDIIHYGKRHSCTEPQCKRQFTTLDQLKVHKWSHYGIVPYRCKYCERVFNKRFLLREHCLKAHQIRLTEYEVAEIFRNNLGYSNPLDMTVAAGDGTMVRRDEWESLPYSLK